MQTSSPTVDSLCTRWIAHKDAGLGVLVIQNGKTIHKKGYGRAVVENDLAVDAATIFDLASLSKHFTATAIMMLEERGKLSYDDPLTKFFPFPPYAQKITIRHLLHHTGGLKDYFELYEADGGDTSRWGPSERPGSAEVVAALALEPRPAFVAGKKLDYSNSGYVVLGQIATKVSGHPLPELMAREVFIPLGMTRTSIYDGSTEADPNQAQGYEDGAPFEGTSLDDVYGDGAVRTTLNDLERWNAAMDAHKIVTRASQDLAWTSGTADDGSETGYGFGWFVGGEDGARWVNHEGEYGGFKTYCCKEIEAGLTVLVLSNFAEAKPDKLADSISEALAAEG